MTQVQQESRRIDPQVILLDLTMFVFLIVWIIIIVILRESVADWLIALRDTLITMALVAISSVAIRYGPRRPRAIIRGLLIIIACGFLFKVAERMQHVFVSGWMDDRLLLLDNALWGVETSAALQRFIHPLLTEWMMFAYVVYIPLLPLTLLAMMKYGGERAVHDYLLNLSLSYLMCYVGFTLYPLATQMHHSPATYTVPLTGWFFTACGEWMRANVHAPGAALPSPHCAAATVILVVFHRYHRRLFYLVLPIILSLYVATVYARYHYLWDSIAGILVATIVLIVSPGFVRWIAKRESPRPL